MRRRMMKSKIHRATVTGAELDYAGSISLDTELMKRADILEFEQVAVLDVDNGNRFETYAIAGDAGQVQLRLYKKAGDGWRTASKAKATRVTQRGRFRKSMRRVLLLAILSGSSLFGAGISKRGGGGKDWLFGADGDDKISGDAVNGDDGADHIFGGDGADLSTVRPVPHPRGPDRPDRRPEPCPAG